MSQLDDLVHYTYQHLFDINPDALIITSDEFESVDKGVVTLDEVISKHVIQIKEKLPARVMDDTTVDMIEIPELFRAINHTKTITGAATLFRSLVQPLTSLELIHAKQDSVKELEKRVELSYKLNEYVNSLVEKERNMYRYFFSECTEFSQYELYRGASVFFKRLVDGVKNVPNSKTQYLETLLEDIRRIDGTHAIELIKGPVYLTFHGLKPKSEIKFFTPRIKFTLRPIKPALLAPFGVAFLALFVPPYDNMIATTAMVFPLLMVGGLAAHMLPREFDYYCFTPPLRDIYVVDKNIRKGVDAIGKIDELLSFHEYYNVMRSKAIDVTIPIVNEADQHYFVAKEAINPVILNTKSYCVPIDINLNGQKLTIMTGAISCGKSTSAKTCTHHQDLGQIGSPVPAKHEEMSIADHIYYQRPVHDKLKDPEGTFGTELEKTKDYLFSSTSKSLVILDRVISGTIRRKEELYYLYYILDGFYKKNGNTIVVTHDDELADKFREDGKGVFLKGEFKKGMPTYKLVPGISRKSHADLVAKKIGFAPEDIKKHLEEKGYLKK